MATCGQQVDEKVNDVNYLARGSDDNILDGLVTVAFGNILCVHG
jgi:hypothetical protein